MDNSCNDLPLSTSTPERTKQTDTSTGVMDNSCNDLLLSTSTPERTKLDTKNASVQAEVRVIHQASQQTDDISKENTVLRAKNTELREELQKAKEEVEKLRDILASVSILYLSTVNLTK